MAEEYETGGRPSKKPRLSYTETIEVLVGSEKRQFHLYKHTICARSPFFQAACSDRWANGSKTIELPVDDPDIFDIYLYCMYNNKVDVGSKDHTIDGEEESNTPLFKELNRLVRACILADKLRDLETTNLLVDAIIELSDAEHEIPGWKIVGVVVNNTTSGAPLRRLMVDFTPTSPL